MSRRVVIADDEPLVRERIRTLLDARAGYQVVCECGDGPATVAAMLEHRPDLLFLDIRMPGLDGFEALAAIDAATAPPAIIFVTAYGEHAARAFDVGAIDYLMKPFDVGRFARALDRVEARDGSAALPAEVRAWMAAVQSAPQYPERFAVRAARHIYFVAAAEIEWADVTSNYVRLHVQGRVHLIRDTLTAFAARVDPERFVRVHRSALVRIDQIVRIEPHERGDYRITLRDGTRLLSSRAWSDRIRALVR